MVTLKNGQTIELKRPHLKGGSRKPLSRDEIIQKYFSNLEYGEFPKDQGQRLLDLALNIPKLKDLSPLLSFIG
ncbi:MAG: hypothetical protein LBF38_12800 [Deltaproteobacteria bacterium]|nr:hypothetical protein [Deltaproteobacteria bacterium]